MSDTGTRCPAGGRAGPGPGAFLARLLSGLLLCFVAAAAAAAQALPLREPPPFPAEVRSELTTPVLSGNARLRFWGLNVYDAALWVEPDFRPDRYALHPFALELRYLRDFRAEDISARSIQEMQKLAPMSEAQAGQWRLQLRQAFPDVRAGDRITGLHLPGRGAWFFTNGRSTGRITDPQFAAAFFGIWLSEASPEPGLRTALLARDGPR